jgi:phospholipid/cholesterol/gamma-HCH transport system substrate-binding protein
MSREFKVGLFIVSTTVIILAALLYLAFEKGLFAKVHTFTLSSKSGDGFTEGMPVVFSGFNIGKVSVLELNDKGLVLIRIKIPQRHVKWVKNDSAFILYRPLIGAARIVVMTNNLNSPALSTDIIKEVETVNDINDAITKVQPLIEKITQIAENIERLSFSLADPRGNLNHILSNAEKITATLSTKKSLLEMAVADHESIKSVHEALRKAKDIVADVDKVMKKVDNMADKTDEQLYGKEGSLPQINKILKDIAGKLEKLDTTVDNINKISKDTSEGMKDFRMLRSDIDDAVNAIDDAVKKIDTLISAKKNPEFNLP